MFSEPAGGGSGGGDSGSGDDDEQKREMDLSEMGIDFEILVPKIEGFEAEIKAIFWVFFFDT